nr:helix-turn-helix domain-containing protein [Clostridium tyrobutyricum]
MKKAKKLIPFYTIKAASDGDVMAIRYILKHYEGT